MSDGAKRQPGAGFIRTFVLPALLIFLIPALSLAFFRHAENSFDEDAREATLQQIREDANLTPEEKENAVAFFSEHPFSELVLDEEFAAGLEPTSVNYYAMFRWLIRLSLWSIIAGVVVLILAGACVVTSLRSQRAQYLSLSVGWQVLKIYGALQTIIQGILLVALSFWVTALWFESYYPKLIFIAGALALVAMALVIKAIFKQPRAENIAQGKVLNKESAGPLWAELSAICEKVGTAPPDQIIAGIDDNFYVTEMPLTVDGTTYAGRTLFVSLSMLKQMRGAEADAILAHEMAHFSGNDTLYSKKISPLLARYGTYLQALYEGGVTRPIFYFMNCFRALYELSLSRHSRQREFRADRIAADATSPRDFAGGLLRVIAYSSFRNEIQEELFNKEQALETANILERIEAGFHEYALKFASDPEIGSLETAHPFDTHPPLCSRLEAIGVPLQSHDARALLDVASTGRWYQKIDGAERLEREQWDDFEQKFREFHEETLAWRFLPETDVECAVVLRAFPELSIESKDGVLTLDYKEMNYSDWDAPVKYHEITGCALDDNGTLQIQYVRSGKKKQSLKLKRFAARQQEALDAINRYYSRYRNAVEYQKQKQAAAAAANKQQAGEELAATV